MTLCFLLHQAAQSVGKTDGKKCVPSRMGIFTVKRGYSCKKWPVLQTPQGVPMTADNASPYCRSRLRMAGE